MILIASGAYLNTEFLSLLGRLPPSFLPVGNRRLYEWQIEDLAGIEEPVFLSIPDDFQPEPDDLARLEAAGVHLLRIPPGMSLGQSVVFSINIAEAAGGPVRILHGDTLCGPLKAHGLDVVVAGATDEYYSWAEYHHDETGRLRMTEGYPSGATPRNVLAGYFAVSDGAALARCISLSEFSFIGGIDLYGQEHDLRAEHSRRWLDFGHVQTYYKSKARHTTERAFNQLNATPQWIEKSSDDEAKILAEAAWFEALPRELRVSTPQYLGRTTDAQGRQSYRLEYLYLNTLSEIVVFGILPVYSWQRVFDLCERFLAVSREKGPQALAEGSVPVTSAAYREKTEQRLTKFAADTGFDLDAPCRIDGRAMPSLSRIAEEVGALVRDARTEDLGLSHGDFCFSNIFFDFRSGQIRVVDPRGRDFTGTVTPWGDMRYDVAKFMHSVLGRYDFLIAGRYRLERPASHDFALSFPSIGNNGVADFEGLFETMALAGYSPNSADLQAMMIQLFLSMLPLHYDRPDRQIAFIANALRLYARMDQRSPA